MLKRLLLVIGRRLREYLDSEMPKEPTPAMKERLTRLDEVKPHDRR
jgi:hypothetical protein